MSVLFAVSGDIAPVTGDAVVMAVVEPSDPDATVASFYVLLDNGNTVEFDHDPGVEVGQHVGSQGSRYAPDGLIVGDELVPARNFTGSDDDVALMIVAIFFLTPLALMVAPLAWGIRSARQIRRDLLIGKLDEFEANYIGSWRWRGLAPRLMRGTEWRHVAAVPVAVRIPQGKIRWLTAPAHALERLVVFEEYLRQRDTAVILRVHPATGVLSSMASVDGERHLDFGSDVDVLGLDAGLPLVFSRRSRRRRLPDR
jgi:hypothetical protein